MLEKVKGMKAESTANFKKVFEQRLFEDLEAKGRICDMPADEELEELSTNLAAMQVSIQIRGALVK